MIKSEKVIRGLKCLSGQEPEGNCSDCVYIELGMYSECMMAVADDAIRLIEEQKKKLDKAVKPKRYPETRYSGELIACGDCRHELSGKQQRFCPFCGKAILWESR